MFGTNRDWVTGCDNHCRRLGAGVYFHTLKTENDRLTHKLVLTSKKQQQQAG